jgi:hypothetical protein
MLEDGDNCRETGAPVASEHGPNSPGDDTLVSH